MLKRSFAEHHAQKAQPGNIAQVEKAEHAIQGLQNREWPSCYRSCSREEIESYHRHILAINEYNTKKKAQLMVSRLCLPPVQIFTRQDELSIIVISY